MFVAIQRSFIFLWQCFHDKEGTSELTDLAGNNETLPWPEHWMDILSSWLQSTHGLIFESMVLDVLENIWVFQFNGEAVNVAHYLHGLVVCQTGTM